MGANRLRSRAQETPATSEQEIVETIADVLAGAVTVVSVHASIANLLSLLPISWPAALAERSTQAIASIVLSGRNEEDDAQEAFFKAHYAVNAAKRIRDALDGDEEGTDADRIQRALRAEARYHAQHLDAADSRMAAKDMVRSASRRFGSVLGWYSVRDSHTDERCRSLHGSNFDADNAPKDGFPGTLDGGNCRCFVGPPFPDGNLIN